MADLQVFLTLAAANATDPDAVAALRGLQQGVAAVCLHFRLLPAVMWDRGDTVRRRQWCLQTVTSLGNGSGTSRRFGYAQLCGVVGVDVCV